MFYLNQLINAVYNIFSNDKNTLIGNDNDPLEISENHNGQILIYKKRWQIRKNVYVIISLDIVLSIKMVIVDFVGG